MTDDLFDSPGESTDDAGVARDRWGRYLLPDPTAHTKSKPQPYTRATTFAGSVADTFKLGQWQQRMVAKGLTLAPELYALAAATPLEERDTLNTVCDDASKVAGSRSRATLGTAMHAFTEGYDKALKAGQPAPFVPAQYQPEIAAYAELVAGLGIEWVEIERIVVVPEFGVAGTFDRIGRLTRPLTVGAPGTSAPEEGQYTLPAGSHVIVDLKTGRDLSYSWHEIAIQLALYAHGFGMWNRQRGAYDRMPEGIDQDVALVIHLPVRDDDTQPAQATLHAVDIAEGWRAAELCRQVRVWRKVKNLAWPVVGTPVLDNGDPVFVFESEMATLGDSLAGAIEEFDSAVMSGVNKLMNMPDGDPVSLFESEMGAPPDPATLPWSNPEHDIMGDIQAMKAKMEMPTPLPVRVIERVLTADELLHHLTDAHGYTPEPFPGESGAGFRGRMADAHYAMHPDNEPYGTTPHKHAVMDRPAEGRAVPALVPDGGGVDLRKAPVRRRKKAAPADVCGKSIGTKAHEWCPRAPGHTEECGIPAPGSDPRSVEIVRDMTPMPADDSPTPVTEINTTEPIQNNNPEHSPPTSTMDSVPVTLPDRIAAAASPADLSAIYREAAGKGLWTPALADLGKARLVALRS